MKYSFEIKLKAVKAIKKGILIKEPYNKICRQWRDRVKHWEKIYDKHDEDGLIFQSDQGWQYQSIYYQNELKKRNIRQSFSRKGNCTDNSIMENFFGIMK